MDDKKVIRYLVNRKVVANMELIRLYNGKAEYPDFPTRKLLAQNDKMRRIRKLFDNGFITFDDAVKAIADDSKANQLRVIPEDNIYGVKIILDK